MALRRSIAGSIRARSPFSLKSSGSKKQWQRESDAIGRNLSEQGWSSEDISSVGHTLVDPSLADFAIIHIPPVSPTMKDEKPIKEVEGGLHEHGTGEVDAEDDGPHSESGVEVGREPPASPAKDNVQKIRPAFILAPRPFIPGISKPAGPPRRSLSFHREPTPTASLSRKGSTRRSRSWNGKEREKKRMTARRMDSRRNRLTWPARALSTLRRKRITDTLGDAQSLRIGFDSAILLTGFEDEVDEFGRKTTNNHGKLPEDIPLPSSPSGSAASLPLDDEDQPTHQPRDDANSSTSSLTSSSASSFSQRNRPVGTSPYLLGTGKRHKFRPYYTRPLPTASKRNQLHWEHDPFASTYLFIQTIIVFAEPVLPDLNFLPGAKVPGVSELGRRSSEEPIGRAI
ncbi:hypothetical protein FS837_009129 [Tulasnella sp. UAMH 9824]|nr:hypothetical protein FS837_009129 [Tulasnella sp. UAMH 9824]